MSTLLGSASMLDRTLECPASNQLPQTAPQHPNAAPAAARGTALHTVMEHGPELGEGALELIHEQYHVEARSLLGIIRNTAATNTGLSEREVSFVYRGEDGTAECLGRNVNREYGRVTRLGPRDITLTLDVVKAGYLSVEVNDYKFGKHVANANGAAQLAMGGLAATRALAPRAEYVVVNFQKIRKDQRRKEDCWRVVDDHALFTRVELDLFERRVQRALVKAEEARVAIEEGREPEVKEGRYCFFCPSRTSCPAKRR